MREIIKAKLREIEEKENVKILLAVESGSRAWGFASPDSDFDVRFVYIRNKESYLRLDTICDVIEIPIDEVLDINGWDLSKTLRLLHRSNPTLFEWFSSPIVYIETDFADRFRSLMAKYFSSKRALYHYISMAEKNYRGYLKSDMVRAKKYFYVIRPILACSWILNKGTPPPMLFSELAASELPECLSCEVKTLLDLKMNTPEIAEIPRIDVLNEFIEKSFVEIRDRIELIETEKTPEWDELNTFFLNELSELI